MGKRLAVISGKGGVGKTTLAAGLGIAMARYKTNVALVDADIGLNNLDVILGMEDDVNYDINDVMIGKCRLKQALIIDNTFQNLKFLPSVGGYPEDKQINIPFYNVIEELNFENDVTIIDSPAGMDSGVRRVLAASDEVVVITTPHISAIRDADKIISMIATFPNVKLCGVVVNRARDDLITKGYMMSPFDIAKLLRCELLIALPENDEYILNTKMSRNFSDCNLMDACFERLAAKLLNIDTSRNNEKISLFKKMFLQKNKEK